MVFLTSFVVSRSPVGRRPTSISTLCLEFPRGPLSCSESELDLHPCLLLRRMIQCDLPLEADLRRHSCSGQARVRGRFPRTRSLHANYCWLFALAPVRRVKRSILCVESEGACRSRRRGISLTRGYTTHLSPGDDFVT